MFRNKNLWLSFFFMTLLEYICYINEYFFPIDDYKKFFDEKNYTNYCDLIYCEKNCYYITILLFILMYTE